MATAAVSGNIALTNDYVWRGSSQTQENPAAQAGFGYTHASGAYASAWGSNVDFGPGSDAGSEFDVVVGWRGPLSREWAVDVSAIRYLYPSAGALNWNEVNASLVWRDDYALSIGYSDDAMATGTSGTYVSLAAAHAFSDAFRGEASVGRYFLDSTAGESYTHGSVGVVWAFRSSFELRTTFHATDSAAKRLFPGVAGSRLEVALQAGF